MKYKVILKKSYQEFEFIFDTVDEAGMFIVTALRHSEGLEAMLENVCEEADDDE